MKRYLIALLVFAVSPAALASNGSGTMGIVAITNSDAMDLRATPIIRFDGVSEDGILISKIVDVALDGTGIIKQAKVPAILVPSNWAQALEQSKRSQTFEFVLDTH
ncbi:MAG: hypothetical protein EOP06_00320 [Proteobacteria bacterium]|nr:MAG: hypothetical protein EOP06_00320 [Pseudomonadota bacterium]